MNLYSKLPTHEQDYDNSIFTYGDALLYNLYESINGYSVQPMIEHDITPNELIIYAENSSHIFNEAFWLSLTQCYITMSKYQQDEDLIVIDLDKVSSLAC